MSYSIHTTDAIVIRNAPAGEADATLHLLTRDLGLIAASARGLRTPQSKLRGALSEYCTSSVSCVRGRGGWRLTDAVSFGNGYFSLPPLFRAMLARVATLISRMVAGEEPHPEIFETMQSGYEYLSRADADEIQNIECLLVLRLLYHLGYVAKNDDMEIFLSNTSAWNESVMTEVSARRGKLVKIINVGLSASHLTP